METTAGLKQHGITETTAQNILLAAGAYYKNMKRGAHYIRTDAVGEGVKKAVSSITAEDDTEVLLSTVKETLPEVKEGDYVKYMTDGFYGNIFGATSGGGRVSITPEYLDLEVDGATVFVRGLKQKVGETAVMEINLTEFSRDLICDSLHLEEDNTKTVAGYYCYRSKRTLDDNDYLDNVAFVGTKVDGGQIIIIFPNALVTGAFEVEGNNKTQARFTITIECAGSFSQSDLEHLPYEIWYPDQETA